MSEIHDLAAPYVLGALEPEEIELFETHLDGCPSCQKEIEQLGEGLAAAAFADAEAPPPHMRDSVLAAVEEFERSDVVERAPRRLSARFLVPAVAVTAVVLLATFALLGGDPVEEILAAPDAVAIDLTVTEFYPGSPPQVARVVFSESQGAAAVQFSGLASPSSEMTYQLWLIGQDGPVSAGTFRPAADGTASIRLDGVAAAGQLVGITQEPDGGSPAPSDDILFAAKL